MYRDTSALPKIYVPESGSDCFLNLIAGTERPICTSVIAEVEIHCALIRKKRAEEIRPKAATRAMNRFNKACAEARIIRISCGDEMTLKAREIIEAARSPPPACERLQRRQV